MPRICSRSSGVSSGPCTETACSAAVRMTSSSSPMMVSVQFDSLGKRRQSAILRAILGPPFGVVGCVRCTTRRPDSQAGSYLEPGVLEIEVSHDPVHHLVVDQSAVSELDDGSALGI